MCLPAARQDKHRVTNANMTHPVMLGYARYTKAAAKRLFLCCHKLRVHRQQLPIALGYAGTVLAHLLINARYFVTAG
jgi:hypothetical protein